MNSKRKLPWWVRLLAERQSIEGGWAPLCKAIDAANPQSSHCRRHNIDKATLKRLCEGMDPRLSLLQFQAIDRYLAKHNLPRLSQRPLFDHIVSPLSLFPHGSRIAIVVGSRYLENARTEFISKHDARAMRQFHKHPIGRDCTTFHDDILGREPLHLNVDRSRTDWTRLVERARTPNIITVGSPLANRATELLACEIIGLEPFEKALDCSLPVRFIVPSAKGFRSAFFFTTDDIGRLRPKPDLRGFDPDRHRAIIVGDRVFLSMDDQVHQPGDVYSVLLMARARENAGVQACVIGSSGPATVGLAKMVTADGAMHCPVLPLRKARRAAEMVLVAVVRTRVVIAIDFTTGGPPPFEDPRQVRESEVVMAPTLFAKIRGKWRKV